MNLEISHDDYNDILKTFTDERERVHSAGLTNRVLEIDVLIANLEAGRRKETRKTKLIEERRENALDKE